MDSDTILANYEAKIICRVIKMNEELNILLLEESIINDDIINLIDRHISELYEMIDKLESFYNISLEINFHRDKLVRVINLEIKRHICIKNKFLESKSNIDLSECNEISDDINEIFRK